MDGSNWVHRILKTTMFIERKITISHVVCDITATMIGSERILLKTGSKTNGYLLL